MSTHLAVAVLRLDGLFLGLPAWLWFRGNDPFLGGCETQHVRRGGYAARLPVAHNVVEDDAEPGATADDIAEMAAAPCGLGGGIGRRQVCNLIGSLYQILSHPGFGRVRR